MSEILGNRRTFEDTLIPEPVAAAAAPDAEGEGEVDHRKSPSEDVAENALPRLSGFDILVYAYLKEALVNTSQSSEAAHLKSCENLMWFVKYMDLITDYGRNTLSEPQDPETETLLQKSEGNRLTQVKTDPDFVRRLLNDEFR